MLNYNRKETNEEFKFGFTLQLCPLTSLATPFRLRTLLIGHCVRPTYRVIGTGNRMIYKFIETHCTIVEDRGARFDVKINTTSCPLDKTEKCKDYHTAIPNSQLLPNLVETLTQYQKRLIPGINTWFRFDNNSESFKVKAQILACLTEIFKTDREAETYFPDVLKENMRLLMDSTSLSPKEGEGNADEAAEEVFDSLYEYELEVDKQRGKKKGADKRLLTKVCSFITLVTTLTSNSDVSDSLQLEKEGGFTIKEIAKYGFLAVLNDYCELLDVLDGKAN